MESFKVSNGPAPCLFLAKARATSASTASFRDNTIQDNTLHYIKVHTYHTIPLHCIALHYIHTYRQYNYTRVTYKSNAGRLSRRAPLSFRSSSLTQQIPKSDKSSQRKSTKHLMNRDTAPQLLYLLQIVYRKSS